MPKKSQQKNNGWSAFGVSKNKPLGLWQSKTSSSSKKHQTKDVWNSKFVDWQVFVSSYKCVRLILANLNWTFVWNGWSFQALYAYIWNSWIEVVFEVIIFKDKLETKFTMCLTVLPLWSVVSQDRAVIDKFFKRNILIYI